MNVPARRPDPVAERETPLVSVIVPTHDRPGALSRCLAALARLDYPAGCYEVLVVDDGSDPPIDPAAFRVGRTARWLRQPNGGPASARNAGLAAAAGDIVAFTDDDCEPDPGWLDALVDAIGRAPEALVGGRTVTALESNACAEASQAIVDGARDWMRASGSEFRFHPANNLAARAAVLRSLRGFDPSFRTAEDRELADRWIRSGRPLVDADGAIVRHRHEMRLGGFWRQHVGYGRGAKRLHAARRRRGGGRFRPSLSYCWRALRDRRLAVPPSGTVTRLALLGVWMAANATGYALQWFADCTRRATAGRGARRDRVREAR